VKGLIDALKLSRASGVAIENLAGNNVENPHPFNYHAQSGHRPRSVRRWS
jgi:hypothetical protein